MRDMRKLVQLNGTDLICFHEFKIFRLNLCYLFSSIKLPDLPRNIILMLNHQATLSLRSKVSND